MTTSSIYSIESILKTFDLSNMVPSIHSLLSKSLFITTTVIATNSCWAIGGRINEVPSYVDLIVTLIKWLEWDQYWDPYELE